MTLLELREQFVKASGRTDLVVDTQNYADNGADRFIRAGQKFLDDILPTPKSSAEVKKKISQGTAEVSFPQVRSILKVRVQESGEKPQILDELPLFKFYDKYGDLKYIKSEADEGKPKRYALGILRDEFPTSFSEGERQIIFHPPADGNYDLVLTAEYFSAQLEDDSDESWWSIVYPNVLIMSARRRLEIEHRNREGARQFEEHIRRKLQDIDSNIVREDSSGIASMENAW